MVGSTTPVDTRTVTVAGSQAGHAMSVKYMYLCIYVCFSEAYKVIKWSPKEKRDIMIHLAEVIYPPWSCLQHKLQQPQAPANRRQWQITCTYRKIRTLSPVSSVTDLCVRNSLLMSPVESCCTLWKANPVLFLFCLLIHLIICTCYCCYSSTVFSTSMFPNVSHLTSSCNPVVLTLCYCECRSMQCV